MPDIQGRPLPGEPNYDAYAKSMGEAGTSSGRAASWSRMGMASGDPGYSAFMAGPDAYAEWQKVQGQANASAGRAAESSKAGLGGTDPLQQGGVSPPAGAPTPQPYLEDLWKKYGGAFFGPTYGGTNMPGLKDQLGKPGQAEDFYESSKDPASDPYYQRQLQLGTDSLNQQMAARGHGTGAAGGAVLGNFESGLFANQYAQRGGLAKTAQDEGLARAGLLGQLGNAADATDTARLQGAFTAAGGAQNLNMDSVNSYLDRVTGLDTASAKLISDSFGKAGDLSSEAGRAALEAQVRADIARAGGTQAQQDAALGALEGLFKALAA